MEFSELVTRRHSVRKYLSDKVETEKRNVILEAGRIAPTAANLQPVKVIVVEEEANLIKLSRSANIYSAPLAFIVCADHEAVWTRHFDNKKTSDIDASIVTDHMMLQAEELGLGSVWICYFRPDVLKQDFSIPDNLEAVNILAVGYSAETESPDKIRKDMKQFAFFEHL